MNDVNNHAEHKSATTTPVKDPVCGMDVDPSGCEHVSEHDGHTFHFCSGHCRAKFDANPQAYLMPDGREHAHHGHDLGHDHVAATPQEE